MRIAVLTTSYPRDQADDAGIFVARLAEALSEAGHKITVIVPRDRAEPLQEERRGVSIWRYRYTVFGSGRLAFGMGLIPNIRRNPTSLLQAPGLIIGMLWTLYRSGPCEMVQANWIGAGGVAWLYSLFTGQGYIVTLRGSDVPLVGRARWLARLILHRARAVVVVGESLKTELAIYLPKLTTVVTIPNGIELVLPSAVEGAAVRDRYNVPKIGYLLAVGSVIPRKRIELLLQLCAGLDGANLVIAGRSGDSEYQASLEAQAQQLGVSDRVQFLGAVAPQDIAAILQGAGLFVSGSQYEGRPNALLEAMYAGVPVAVSDIPAHRELVEDGRSGIILGPDQGDNCKKVYELLSNPSKRSAFIEAGRRVVASLTWSGTAQQYEKLLMDSVY